MAGISAPLCDVVVQHIDQTRENNATFLRHLGKKYDPVATFKNDTLLFIPINQSHIISGKALPLITIIHSLGDGHHYNSAKRDN